MLLRFLLFVIILYLVFRLLGRYVLPWLVKRYVRNVQKKYYRDNPHMDPRSRKKGKQKKEGNIHIKRSGKKDDSRNDDSGLGEYVDYEDINDD